jgi:hypothetical protein
MLRPQLFSPQSNIQAYQAIKYKVDMSNIRKQVSFAVFKGLLAYAVWRSLLDFLSDPALTNTMRREFLAVSVSAFIMPNKYTAEYLCVSLGLAPTDAADWDQSLDFH